MFTTGLPPGSVAIGAEVGAAYELPPQGNQRFVLMAPSDAALTTGVLAQRSEALRDQVVYTGTVPMASAELLGIAGDPASFDVTTLSVGGVTLATASPLDAVRDTIAATRRLLWIIGPALVALVAGLAWLLAGRALRPVHLVTSRVASIGSDSLHERVPVPSSDDEIAELARTMNGMLGRLESATSTSRRLVSDASHELRTPVTVMRTELEVARRSDDADWDATSSVLLGELDRMQGLVDDLLLLARGDERAFARTSFSIADVARDVAARTRRVPVDVTVGDGVDPLVGDEDAVRRAVDHVVANAARHAASRRARGRRGRRPGGHGPRRRRRAGDPRRSARRGGAPVRPARRGSHPRRRRGRPRARRHRRRGRRPRRSAGDRRLPARRGPAQPGAGPGCSGVSCSRRIRLSAFPDGLRGISSTNVTADGRLYRASLPSV